jgi:site-specific DNA-methyltransferase (cytosine-N4-specific)
VSIAKQGLDIASRIQNSDWNFWNAETDYLTHSVHRYSGKFIPQIAAAAIDVLTSPGDLVVDPYCGSGTTLLEAALAGRRAIGVDLNPLAVLIASVKTHPVQSSDLSRLTSHMKQVVGDLDTEGLFRTPPSERDRSDARLSDAWFQKWFQQDVLADLVVIHNAICGFEDVRLRNIGLVAFSEILRRSSNAHQGYPNVMFDRNGGKRPRPGRNFLKALNQITAAVASLPKADWKSIRVLHGDARKLPLEAGSVDAVISHPPYVGSIPYAEYGALSLKWLGHDPKLIDRELTGGQRQSRTVLERFTSDYQKMILEAFRILRADGHLFLLVGNPTIKGVLVDLAEMTRAHATAAGFRQVTIATRSAENRRANKMGDETLLTFVK